MERSAVRAVGGGGRRSGRAPVRPSLSRRPGRRGHRKAPRAKLTQAASQVSPPNRLFATPHHGSHTILPFTLFLYPPPQLLSFHRPPRQRGTSQQSDHQRGLPGGCWWWCCRWRWQLSGLLVLLNLSVSNSLVDDSSTLDANTRFAAHRAHRAKHHAHRAHRASLSAKIFSKRKNLFEKSA